ncbi:MAG: choice-of-anchor Q domain-containing protein [Brevefilum sp.]
MDAVVCADGVAVDQRLVLRPYGDLCDIGAYEYNFEGYNYYLPLFRR